MISYTEACEDSIPMCKVGTMNLYSVKCHSCGNYVQTYSYRRGLSYTCDVCKTLGAIETKDNRVATLYESKERKLENAIDRISAVADIRKYSNAIEVVQSKLHRDGWFDSTEEILAALELIKNGIKSRHQVKFGRYRVDFVLPDEKVILEIDGHVFHHKGTRKKEQMRDNLILLSLGVSWEVIRISDTDINQNITKLIPAIRKVKENRQKLRDENNGVLPDWYMGNTV